MHFSTVWWPIPHRYETPKHRSQIVWSPCLSYKWLPNVQSDGNQAHKSIHTVYFYTDPGFYILHGYSSLPYAPSCKITIPHLFFWTRDHGQASHILVFHHPCRRNRFTHLLPMTDAQRSYKCWVIKIFIKGMSLCMCFTVQVLLCYF